MAAPSNTALLNFIDSVTKSIIDYNAIIVASSLTTGATNINTGVGGTGASATLGRVLAFTDPTSELALLSATNTVVTNIATYLTSLQSITPYYQQLFGTLDKLDSYISANVTTGGTNAWLAANALQVSAWYAAAFNLYATGAVTLGLRSPATAPTAIAVANYFPYAAVDPMFSFTCGTGTSMTSTTPGSATSTQGGGVATISLYKNNATNAIGGATFTITYVNAAGANATTTYSTVSGTPTASGTLASGSVSLNVQAQSIVSVTGTGMTNAEQYKIGASLVRTISSY